MSNAKTIDELKAYFSFELRRPVYHGTEFVKNLEALLQYVESIEQSHDSAMETMQAMQKRMNEMAEQRDELVDTVKDCHGALWRLLMQKWRVCDDYY